MQQGGVKALLGLAAEGTDKGKVVAAQALARIAITINPEVAFPGQRVRVGVDWGWGSCGGGVGYLGSCKGIFNAIFSLLFLPSSSFLSTVIFPLLP